MEISSWYASDIVYFGIKEAQMNVQIGNICIQTITLVGLGKWQANNWDIHIPDLIKITEISEDNCSPGFFLFSE